VHFVLFGKKSLGIFAPVVNLLAYANLERDGFPAGIKLSEHTI